MCNLLLLAVCGTLIIYIYTHNLFPTVRGALMRSSYAMWMVANAIIPYLAEVEHSVSLIFKSILFPRSRRKVFWLLRGRAEILLDNGVFAILT